MWNDQVAAQSNLMRTRYSATDHDYVDLIPGEYYFEVIDRYGDTVSCCQQEPSSQVQPNHNHHEDGKKFLFALFAAGGGNQDDVVLAAPEMGEFGTSMGHPFTVPSYSPASNNDIRSSRDGRTAVVRIDIDTGLFPSGVHWTVQDTRGNILLRQQASEGQSRVVDQHVFLFLDSEYSVHVTDKLQGGAKVLRVASETSDHVILLSTANHHQIYDFEVHGGFESPKRLSTEEGGEFNASGSEEAATLKEEGRDGFEEKRKPVGPKFGS